MIFMNSEFSQVDKFLVVDLTEEEYQCLDSQYVISADYKGDIHGINKIGIVIKFQ